MECEAFAKNMDILKFEKVEVDIGFNTSFDAVTAYHEYFADIVLPFEYSDISDCICLDIDEKGKILLGEVGILLCE